MYIKRYSYLLTIIIINNKFNCKDSRKIIRYMNSSPIFTYRINNNIKINNKIVHNKIIANFVKKYNKNLNNSSNSNVKKVIKDVNSCNIQLDLDFYPSLAKYNKQINKAKLI